MSPLHFACRGLLEALGCAFVGFQFRHISSISSSISPSASSLPAASCRLSVLVFVFNCSGIFPWKSWRDSRPDSIRSKSATDAKLDSELPRLRPAPAACHLPVPPFPVLAFLAPASLSPAPAFFPASLSAWLLFLFPSRAPPPSSSEPYVRGACCVPAS